MRKADNTALYTALSGAEYLTDIGLDAQCAMAPGYQLIRTDHRLRPSGDEFEIALINDVESSVVYYNCLMISMITDLTSRPATQNLVWRSSSAQHAAVLRDVAQKVFFNYILERYDVLLSDNPHTGEGLFFWQRQMSNAIAYGLHVYYQQGQSMQFQPIPTQEALNSLTNQLWSCANEEQSNLALISKVVLPLELHGGTILKPTG